MSKPALQTLNKKIEGRFEHMRVVSIQGHQGDQESELLSNKFSAGDTVDQIPRGKPSYLSPFAPYLSR